MEQVLAAIRVRLATGMSLVDSIIAATAILAGLAIVTSDEGFLKLGRLATVFITKVQRKYRAELPAK